MTTGPGGSLPTFRVFRRAVFLGLAVVAVSACGGDRGSLATDFRFVDPQEDQLSRAGEVEFTLKVPAGGAVVNDSLSVRLDGDPVPAGALRVSSTEVQGTLSGVQPGGHELTASARVRVGDTTSRSLDAAVAFETAALENPVSCEFLNQAHCMLPYPSSRFLKRADTPTGWRLDFPESGMPEDPDGPLSPEPYRVLDGFSPTAQVLMHFPGPGVDLAASGAPRLTDGRLLGTGPRATDLTSVEEGSPTVLIDAKTGRRILHWLERDVRAQGNPDRQVVFLRPGESLEPGRRYIVAVRDLVDVDGNPVPAEPAFTVFRDERPTDIAPLAARRDDMEDVFGRLEQAGVAREDLILAFDFVVQSEQGLTGEMKAMRDDTFELFETQGPPGFTVDNVTTNDCSQAGTFVWREVTGTFEVPLYLTRDPEKKPSEVSFLRVDDEGRPRPDGVTEPPYTIAIPCAVLENTGEIIRPLVMGHGLFDTGRNFLRENVGHPDLIDLEFIFGATDWRGLSDPDLTAPTTLESFVVSGLLEDFDRFAALPDRLRQGMLNTLVLARMMDRGMFNSHSAFRTPDGEGVFPGPPEQTYYFGASLGGINGTMFAALSPDVDKFNPSLAGINFSLMLQRSIGFKPLDAALDQQFNPDPMAQALLISLVHELWAGAEPAGYVQDLREDIAGPDPEKDLLITAAWLDEGVTNQSAKLLARSLDLPTLRGSFQNDLPQMPVVSGPLRSAWMTYDTGVYDPEIEEHRKTFIPPLRNLQADDRNDCSPHLTRGFIPASVDQLASFLKPGGRIENFCEGFCDADMPKEIPFGDQTPCDPRNF